jgi:hypothetical protein
MIPQGRSSWAGASSGQQECCDIPARPSFALTPAPPLLYRPQPRQISQTGKVPAYGTLPPLHLCVGTNVYFQGQEIPTLATKQAVTTQEINGLPNE